MVHLFNNVEGPLIEQCCFFYLNQVMNISPVFYFQTLRLRQIEESDILINAFE